MTTMNDIASDLPPERPQRTQLLDEMVVERCCQLIEYEFDGYNIRNYPPDTFKTITDEILRIYYQLGWTPAWNWLAYDTAKTIAPAKDTFDKRTIHHARQIVADCEGKQNVD